MSASQQLLLGGKKAEEANYIEDVFATHLYTGTGSSQTINNGIDAATKGALFWIKSRNSAEDNRLVDTVRGPNFSLASNTTLAQDNDSNRSITATTSGFTTGPTASSPNASGTTYVSWTFRKQPKFFDVVTWTGNGSGAGIDVAHSLASQPGTVIMKRTDSTSNWMVMHRTDSVTYQLLRLNTTGANLLNTDGTYYTSTSFRAYQFNQDTGVAADNMNVNGATYVAYLFAHNAGGFGLSGTDNVISCGSYNGNDGPVTVNLGYEPQWVLIKSTQTGNWHVFDNMRGMPVTGGTPWLVPNLSNAESSSVGPVCRATATGFIADSDISINTVTYIYIAIRRGPMRTPTTGTSVFSPAIRNGTGTTTTITGVGFPPDVVLSNSRNYAAGYIGQFWDKLRGAGRFLRTPETAAEGTVANAGVLGQSGYTVSGARGGQNDASDPFVDYSFRRAPGFFDEVCYTASSSQLTLNHNLGVVPEMIITKARSNADDWYVWCQHNSSIATGACISLNSSASTASAGGGSLSSFTASSFKTFLPGINGWTVVSYLFASCPGVSRVGTYTGTGTTQTINCGFTGGARFVLIKATSTTGNWLVWDSARGIVAGNDPYLALNSTAAEVTNTDWVDTAASGFELSAASPNLANTNGVSYIFLAIA